MLRAVTAADNVYEDNRELSFKDWVLVSNDDLLELPSTSQTPDLRHLHQHTDARTKPENGRKCLNRILTVDEKRMLDDWILDDINHPYLRDQDRRSLSQLTGLPERQVEQYVLKHRRRRIMSKSASPPPNSERNDFCDDEKISQEANQSSSRTPVHHDESAALPSANFETSTCCIGIEDSTIRMPLSTWNGSLLEYYLESCSTPYRLSSGYEDAYLSMERTRGK